MKIYDTKIKTNEGVEVIIEEIEGGKQRVEFRRKNKVVVFNAELLRISYEDYSGGIKEFIEEGYRPHFVLTGGTDLDFLLEIEEMLEGKYHFRYE